MTLDGAGNMAGRQRSSAACIYRLYPKAIHYYCSSQDLCKTCEVKEIHLMLNSIKQLGIFFNYSPKRSRILEKEVYDINLVRLLENQIAKSKFGFFLWDKMDRNFFDIMFEAILQYLDAIAISETGMQKQYEKHMVWWKELRIRRLLQLFKLYYYKTKQKTPGEQYRHSRRLWNGGNCQTGVKKCNIRWNCIRYLFTNDGNYGYGGWFRIFAPAKTLF